MNALTLGALAALGWGVYDVLVRFVSRGAGSLQAVLFVLVFGAVALGAAAVVSGVPIVPAHDKYWAVALSGIVYALALLAGFRAFAIGPVSLVAPIVATYPVFTMLWAVANGSRPSLSDWSAVVSVLAGVALVARYAAEQRGALPRDTSASSRGAAIVLSGLASFGYAASFAAAQIATQSGVPELSVTLFARLWAIAVILPMSLRAGVTFTGARSWLPLVALMGGLDAFCLLAVNAASSMDDAEYAVVLASTFGVVTVILAVLFLKERLSMLQCIGMVCVFAGIVVLAGRF